MNDSPSVRLTRRRFLVNGTLALLLAGHARGASAAALPPLGFCGSIGQAATGRAAGSSYVEIGLASTCAPAIPDEAFEKWSAEVRAAPLPASRANAFFPGDLKLVGAGRDLARVRDYAERCLARAARAGVKIVTLGSGEARRAPEGTPIPAAVDQFIECGREIAAIARRHGITIAVEPLNRGETNVLNRLADVCAVVDAVDAPNFGATADIYHMLREGEGPEALLAAGKRVRHCHLAEKQGRRPPGSAGEDFSGYFAALQSIGYEGAISMECTWSAFDTELPAALANVSAQWRRAANQSRSSHG